MNRWAAYRRYAAKYETTPLEYLKLKYGYVPHRYLDEIVALDSMVDDVKRMDGDITAQTKEFEAKMKKQGRNFNRLK